MNSKPPFTFNANGSFVVPEPPPRRRRPNFSLRTMFLVCYLALAYPLTIYHVHTAPDWLRQDAAAATTRSTKLGWSDADVREQAKRGMRYQRIVAIAAAPVVWPVITIKTGIEFRNQ